MVRSTAFCRGMVCFLFLYCASMNAMNSIFDAIVSGDHKALEFLLRNNMVSHNINRGYRVPYTMKNGVYPCFLLAVSKLNAYGLAALYHNRAALELLASHTDPCAIFYDGYNALHYLFMRPHVSDDETCSLIKYLLEQGVALEQCSVDGTPLHVAATHQSGQVVSFLLACNAHAQRRYCTLTGDLFTPLYSAAHAGNLYACEKLLLGGARAHDTSDNFCNPSPLSLAAARGYERVCTMLLGHGADPNQQDRGGRTALHRAILEQALDTRRAIYILLKAGAQVNGVDQEGRTPLHYVANMERRASHHQAHGYRKSLVRILMEHGADPLMVDAMSKTPAEIALSLRHTRTGFVHTIVRYLVEHGSLLVCQQQVIDSIIRMAYVGKWLRGEYNFTSITDQGTLQNRDDFIEEFTSLVKKRLLCGQPMIHMLRGRETGMRR